MSYFVLDGLVMNNPGNLNGIQIAHCDHVVLKNLHSLTQPTAMKHHSAYKFSGCNDSSSSTTAPLQWSTAASIRSAARTDC